MFLKSQKYECTGEADFNRKKLLNVCLGTDLFSLRVYLHCVDSLGVSESEQKANRLCKVQSVITPV